MIDQELMDRSAIDRLLALYCRGRVQPIADAWFDNNPTACHGARTIADASLDTSRHVRNPSDQLL